MRFARIEKLRRARAPRFPAVLAAAGSLALASPLLADTASEARLQFELGEELYRQGRYREAVERFIASNRLVRNPNIVLNIARTFAFTDRPVDAFNWYVTYLEFELDAEQRALGVSEQRELSTKVAVLEVVTEPKGAELFVERVELGSIGSAPRRIAVAGGSPVVIARLAGHRDESASLSVAPGEERRLELRLQALLGRVTVTSRPAGAAVSNAATGVVLGRTPLELELPVGEHELELTLPGFLPERSALTVSDTAPVEANVTLARDRSTVAALWVRGTPNAASVLVDGRAVGRAPLWLDAVAPGRHRVDVSAPGREPWQAVVPAEAGATTRIDVELADPAAATWPGYRFIGYGVAGGLLAAGGVVGLVAVDAKQDFDATPSSAGKRRVEDLNLAADVLFISGAVVGLGTLAWDLLSPPPPRSQGRVTVTR